jgi:hypothetical protein
MGTLVNVREFFGKEYTLLKKNAKYEWRRKSNEEFNEDVFHDTLVKCISQLNDKLMEKDELMAYFIGAFQMNCLRENNYACNSKKSDEDINNVNIDSETTISSLSIDYKMILKKIEIIFGQDYKEIFQLSMEGQSVKEITETTNYKTVRYKLDVVKNWLKKQYKEKDLKD